MKTNRRDFLKAGALAAAAAAMPEVLKAAAAGRNFKKITIAKTSCQFEREPMVRPFGFKGGYLTEEWIVSAYVRSTSGQHGIGLLCGIDNGRLQYGFDALCHVVALL